MINDMHTLDKFDSQTALQAILQDDPDTIAMKDDLLIALNQLKNEQYTINSLVKTTKQSQESSKQQVLLL